MSAPTPRGASTRDLVVEAAAALIRDRGFRATSVGDILARTGLPKGSLYHHFESKEQIGYAVLARWRDDMQARLLGPLLAEDGAPPLDRVTRALATVQTELEGEGCRGGCLLGTLAAELADVHEGFRARLSEAFAGYADAFAAPLRRAVAEGTLRPGTDAAALATFLVAALEGGVLLAKVHRSPAPLATALDVARAHLELHRTGG